MIKKEIVNYDFGIDLIKVIDNENNNQENELKKLFISKIILDLIFNYKGAKVEVDEELREIEDKSIKYIVENEIIFRNYDLNLKNIKEISMKKYILI